MSQLDPDTAGKWIGGTIVGLIWAANWAAEHKWNKSKPVQDAAKVEEARIDVAKVLLDNDKAHVEEIDELHKEHKHHMDQAEAREIHLIATNEGLMRQHSEAMTQLGKDRDDDREEMGRMRESIWGLREEVAECKREAEACRGREQALQSSFEQMQRDHRAAMRAMAARAYSTAKRAEDAAGDHGPFTATDVFPDGKPE